MRTRIAKIILMTCAALWTTTGFSDDHFFTLAEGSKIFVTPSRMLEDPTWKMSASEAYSLLQKKGLSGLKVKGEFSAEYSNHPLWFSFQVRNDGHHNDWCLAAQNAGILDLRVYKIVRDGENLQFVEQKAITNRLATSWLDVDPKETADFIATYRSFENLFMDLSIAPMTEVVKKDLNETTLLGVAAGIMLAVIIYNAFLFLSLRQKFHLFYIIFAITNALIALFSVNFPLGFWKVIHTNIYWTPLLRCLGPLTTFAFASVFLQTKAKHKAIHRLLITYVIGLFLIVAFFSISGRGIESNAVLDPYFLLGIFILLYAGIHAYRKGFTPAKYYTLGLTAFLGGIVICITFPYFVKDPNAFIYTAHVWGQALEMLLMSLALAAEIKLLEEEKFRAVVAAETKSRLLRVISHDIRNPLAIIKGYGNMLSQRMPDEANLHKILRSATVIEEITDVVQKTELDRKRTSELAPVSIRSVFDELSFLFHRSAIDKNIHLNFVVHPDDLKVFANETILTNEILSNIISNAIKFSFSGSSVEIKAFALGEKVRISVKDNGIGIPKSLLPKIFDRQSTETSRRGTSGELGAGFGLPIAYSFIQDFNGEIEVVSTSFEESDDFRGTEFIITLRRASSLAIVKNQDKAPVPGS